MTWIYDLILVLVFVFLILRGWRQGVMATLLRLLGWVVAAFVIIGWAGEWSGRVYESVVEKPVTAAVSAAIPADAVNAMNDTADAVESLQGVLDELSGILGGREIDASSADAIVAMLRQDGASLADAITQTVLEPVLLGVLQAVISLGILIVCLFVFRGLSRLSAHGSRGRGILGKVNKILGGVLGAVEGLAVSYVYAFLLSALASALTVDWLTPAIVNGTALVSLLL